MSFVTVHNFDCLQPEFIQIHKIHFKTEATCLIPPATFVLPLNTQQATQKSREERAVSETLCCVPGVFSLKKTKKSYCCLEIKDLAEAELLKLM